MTSEWHRPVMLREALEALRIARGAAAADGTAGHCGHSLEIARALGPEGTLLMIDRDPRMLATGRARMEEELAEEERPRLLYRIGSYERIGEFLKEAGLEHGVTGILLDLGVNSAQLDNPEFGMSFQHDSPADGRFNPEEGGPTMAQLANMASERQLAQWLREYSDERFAARLARELVRRRQREPFERTSQLAQVAIDVYPRKRGEKIHPATRLFQSLRIAANDELGAVRRGVQACMEALDQKAENSRLAVISFHSGEHKAVKEIMRAAADPRPVEDDPYQATSSEGLQYRLPFRKAISASEEEAAANPRARSAQLRVIERIPEGGRS